MSRIQISRIDALLVLGLIIGAGICFGLWKDDVAAGGFVILLGMALLMTVAVAQ